MATDFIMPRMPDPQQQSAFFQPAFQPHQAVQLPVAFQPPPPLSQVIAPQPRPQPAQEQPEQQEQQQPQPQPQPQPQQQQPQPQEQQQQQQQQQQQAFNNGPQISPLSTSGNGSPTSPKSYLTRQTRPMYMPAVLRPNEFPYKAPAQRVRSADDGLNDERLLRPNSSYLSLSGLSALGRLSRRSTGDSGKGLESTWDLDMFPRPTGIPTRRHWKPDQESNVCDAATCKRYFNYFTRRHHCRKCGNIFCDSHSSFEVPLDQEANFNPRGTPSRACHHCFSEFKQWRSRTNSHSSSLDSSDILNSPTPTSPIVASPAGLARGPTAPHAPEVAMSVPRDWNWSTF